MAITAENARLLAEMLLKIEAVKLRPNQPFTWASGWKSPIYCDNRLSLSYPEIRAFVADTMASIIKTQFAEAEIVAGVATAGIPQAALVAERLGLPLIYIRSSAKEHGMGNLIEGKAQPGKKVVVIEDLISTGGSSLKACKAIQDAEMQVCGMVAAVTYGFGVAESAFKTAQVKLSTITDYSAIIQAAISTGYVSEEDLQTLQDWRNNPAEWGM